MPEMVLRILLGSVMPQDLLIILSKNALVQINVVRAVQPVNIMLALVNLVVALKLDKFRVVSEVQF